MSKMSTLQDLLVEQLQDLYSAETQITQALPKMQQKATSPQLKSAFDKHLAETEAQVQRLEQICRQIGVSPMGKECLAAKGLIAEGQELMSEDADPEVMDAALIAAAQKVEHYEIASYGTVCTWAKELGQTEVLELLKQTLNEEKTTDENLSVLAETGINQRAE